MPRRNWVGRQWFEKGGWKGEQRDKEKRVKLVHKGIKLIGDGEGRREEGNKKMPRRNWMRRQWFEIGRERGTAREAKEAENRS